MVTDESWIISYWKLLMVLLQETSKIFLYRWVLVVIVRSCVEMLYENIIAIKAS